MYLKRILLHGFKSFADRTEFDFGPGQTCVVGPNGCGKSNILDAIRWVLGEQSAKTLRGNKMLDVVFAGSRSRKAANFAEVRLTFDNSTQFLDSDEEEVTVSRTLYRNGDSEYRMNGNRCRMKDIRDLLLDTGVGVDAYSVIEQGRVDLMLQANPIERRELFEEAAGISRYKVRRGEAQRKLERTQNNLLRLNDLIEELERRVRSVKLAAGKARNFQEYDRRLRELRSAHALAEYHELQHAGGRQRTQVDTYSELARARRVSLADRERAEEELEGALAALDERIEAAERELSATRTEAGALAERVHQGERRLSELAETLETQRGAAEEAVVHADGLALRISNEAKGLEALRDAERGEAERIAGLEASRDAARAKVDATRRELERERSAAFEAARMVSRLHSELASTAERADQLDAQLARYDARREELSEQERDQDRRQAELNERTVALDSRASELQQRVGELDRRAAALREQRSGLEDQINARKEQRSGLLSRLELLEQMERKQEGVGQGARWVLDWARGDGGAEGEQGENVAGLVADVLRIDDPRVDALQVVLSRFEDHLVVRDTRAFLESLAQRETPPGRVRLYGMDRLRDDQLEFANLRHEPGVLGCVADWVRCAPEFSLLARRLLGRVFLVESRERAIDLAVGSYGPAWFVTIDGELIESGGGVTLGSADRSIGLISRKAHIRQLRGELDGLETEIEHATRERNELQEQQSDLKLQHEAALQSTAQVQREHAELRTESVRLQEHVTRRQRETAALESESESARRGREALREKRGELARQHADAERKQQTHEEQVASHEQELRELDAVVSRVAQELTAAQVEVGRAAERRSAREAALRELRSQLDALRAARTQAETQARQADERIVQANHELADSRTRGVELAELERQQEQRVERERGARGRIRSRLDACGGAVRRLREEIEQIDEALREAQIALRELEVRREALCERVVDELELELAELYQDYEHVEQDWDAIAEEIDTLRTRITRLGNVNLDAIVELEELTPRYENLIAQRDDLLESVAQLEKLIAQLDDESRERFATCFEEVRENFQDLFRKLFGGGKADIILEDPDNPLECGIEIIARPPGKEPRSISLLSGGEKTMTAVALLFAVFKRKPSPFAVLDEVDAALDEANIDRFNSMLMEFLARSQFIVITHNKRTMQDAGVLYGITMEEPGVSKRVSVRFDDRVEAPNVA